MQRRRRGHARNVRDPRDRRHVEGVRRRRRRRGGLRGARMPHGRQPTVGGGYGRQGRTRTERVAPGGAKRPADTITCPSDRPPPLRAAPPFGRTMELFTGTLLVSSPIRRNFRGPSGWHETAIRGSPRCRRICPCLGSLVSHADEPSGQRPLWRCCSATRNGARAAALPSTTTGDSTTAGRWIDARGRPTCRPAAWSAGRGIGVRGSGARRGTSSGDPVGASRGFRPTSAARPAGGAARTRRPPASSGLEACP